MAHSGYPPQPASKPPMSTADLSISIVVLVLTVVLGVIAAILGLFLLAFLDHCPPQSCSVDGAVTAVGTALLAAVGIGVVGLAATVIQLYRRKPGWPVAVATLMLCGLAVALGGAGYSIAVGG
jgi:quinol-cytochrome oxidoreductase complex cytochrome b subunit